jgi:hypothetical protein
MKGAGLEAPALPRTSSSQWGGGRDGGVVSSAVVRRTSSPYSYYSYMYV